MHRLTSCSKVSVLSVLKQQFGKKLCSTSRVMASEQRTGHQTEARDVITVPSVKIARVPYRHTFANVGYADLGPSDGPVCLTLHGAPGGIQDTVEIAESLTNAGIRLIIPEFPEYGRTTLDQADVFDHSTNARTELITNFLATINVSRVAAVVGHSMGVATAFNLASNSGICQSFVSLSGIGIHPHRTLRPYWFLKTIASILENQWTGPLASRFLAMGYKSRGFNLGNGEHGDHSLKIALVSSTRIDFDQIVSNASRLRSMGMPMLFAMTQSDRLVEWEVAFKTASHCGVEETNFTWFDSDEQITRGPSIDDHSVTYPRALVFERGGHFVHRSHRDIVGTAIVDLIKFVVEPGTKRD